MIEVARNSVQTWNIDEMGHMNVQFYVDRAADGLAALGVHLGLGPRDLREQGRRLAVTGQHIRFLRERHVGAPYHLRAGVLQACGERLTVYQEMVGTTSGDVAATFTLDAELRDAGTDTACRMPDAALERAGHLHTELPAHGRPRGLKVVRPRAAMSLHEADALGMVPTFQAVVQPWQCGDRGYLLLRHFMGHISNAVPNLMARAGVGGRPRQPKVGGAALEYRFAYHHYPRAGDVLALRSAFSAVGEKTYTMCHWLFDVESGAAMASAEALGIALDLEARRAMVMPEAMRTGLQSLVVDGLTA